MLQEGARSGPRLQSGPGSVGPVVCGRGPVEDGRGLWDVVPGRPCAGAPSCEVGHEGATVRESILERVYEIGEKFVKTCKSEYPPGMIGPFALQGAITKDLDIYIFDVSPRVPGSPIISTTSPYSRWYFGEPMSTGRRIAREVNNAVKSGRLSEIVT